MKQMRCITLAGIMVFCAAWIAEAAAPQVVTSTLAEKRPRYVIDVRFPQVKAPRSDAEKNFNRTVRGYVKQIAAHFRQEAADAGEPPNGVPFDLTGRSVWWLTGSRWISVVVRGGEYTGGTHPTPFVHTWLYDLQSGSTMALADLFKPDSHFLDVLSQRALAELRRRKLADDDWMQRGTAPEAANYAFFYLQKTHLVLLFPPYQVAPYSEGYQEIRIPFAELKGIARPDGPLR